VHRHCLEGTKELDQEYETMVSLNARLSKDASPVKYPAVLGLDPTSKTATAIATQIKR